MSHYAKLFGVASACLLSAAIGITIGKKQNGEVHFTPPTNINNNNENSALPVVLPPGVPQRSSKEMERDFLKKCEDIGRLGLPGSQEVRCYGGYISSLNYERRIPNFVMEVYPNENENNDNNNNKASRSKSNFYADPSVPSLFQVKPDSYLHLQDGLSRGHLAPAQSYKHSQTEMDNTFNMNANIVPQDMTLNALDWLRLENLVRKIGKQISNHKDNKLYVISGPAFVSQEVRQVTTEQQQQAVLLETSHTTAGRPKTILQHDVIGRGPHGPTVAVPTHLFKVLLSASNKEYHAAAFLFPNKPLSEERPLTSYQVPLSRLESLTGLQFFPQLPSNQKKNFLNLCHKYKCDHTRTAGLFSHYRDVAALREANSIPQLQATLQEIKKKNTSKETLDAAVQREYERRSEELLKEAMRSIDEV